MGWIQNLRTAISKLRKKSFIIAGEPKHATGKMRT
jgi:hypothetical protein